MSLSILYIVVSACMLLFQSCPALCNAMVCSPPRSSVHGILQARILEWVAFPLPGDLPDPKIKPTVPVDSAFQADFFSTKPQGNLQ